jgi:hypothetical protein
MYSFLLSITQLQKTRMQSTTNKTTTTTTQKKILSLSSYPLPLLSLFLFLSLPPSHSNPIHTYTTLSLLLTLLPLSSTGCYLYSRFHLCSPPVPGPVVVSINSSLLFWPVFLSHSPLIYPIHLALPPHQSTYSSFHHLVVNRRLKCDELSIVCPY